MATICDELQPGNCPAVQVELRWEDWGEAQLKWPLVVQLGLTAVFLLIFDPLYSWACRSRVWCFRELVKTYVGTSERPGVPRPEILIAVYLLQIVVSLASVVIWVLHTYRRYTSPATKNLELAMCFVDIITWMVNRLRCECKAVSLWEFNGLVDVLTVVPTLQCAMSAEAVIGPTDDHGYGYCGQWLSLQFLRSYQTLYCFQRIQETGIIQYDAVLVQMLIQVLFQVYCLLTVMAGTIFTCEVLGDPPLIFDSFLETRAGDRISFFQMVYWVMITVTTVGYGDFAPTTVASRVLTAIFIVIGVAAIFFLEFRVSEFVKRRWEGSGSYRPRSRHDTHVVVVLCLTGAASKLSSMVAGFLQEILHSSHDPRESDAEEPGLFDSCCCCRRRRDCIEWPNVVIFSPTNWDDVGSNVGGEDGGASFNHFLRTRDLPLEARRRVWFLVGKVSSKADLDRAAVGSSAMTILMSDVNSECPDEADGQQIFAAVILRNLYPKIKLRMMLLKAESKELAVQAGVPGNRCFSSRELKANMLAQNVRCHGLVPMITGMLCSAGQEDEEYFLRAADRQDHQRELARGVNAPRRSDASTLKGSHSLEPEPLAKLTWAGSTVSSAGAASAASSTPSRVYLRRMGSRMSLESKTSSRKRGESFAAIKRRLHNSATYFRKETAEYEACDPWMFAYFGGLRRSVHGFELAAHYSGLTFGELVHAIFRDTEALLVGIFENGKVVICPQRTTRKLSSPGQICFAMAEKPSQLDSCRLEGRRPYDWRSRIIAMTEHLAMRAAHIGAHVEASKLCAHQLADSLVQTTQVFTGSRPLSEETSIRRGSDRLPEVPEEGSRVFRRSRSQDSESAWGRGVRERFVAAERKAPGACTSGQTLCPPSPTGLESDLRVSLRSTPPMVVREDLTDEDPLQHVRELRRTLGDFEELVVLVVCNGGDWQQVRNFVKCLRAMHLPVYQPIVVLVPSQPPPGVLQDCGDRVVVVKGNGLCARVLLNSGILEASAVAVMTGEVPTKGHFNEPVFKDFQVMLVAQELECWCGISEREVFTTYELQDSRSVRHLPLLMSKPSVQLQDYLEEQKTGANWISSDDSAEEFEDSFEETPVAALLSEYGACDPTTRGGLEESVLFHPRFAAGQVFTPEIWGSMLGRAFYNPAIIETVEALVMPHRRGQRAFPWQIRVPAPYVGQPYSELVKDMALGGWETGPPGIFEVRNPDQPRRFSNAGLEEPPEPAGSGNGMYIRQPPEGPAVPIALYRSRDDIGYPSQEPLDSSMAQGTGGHNYIILAPSPDTKIRAEDWVLVIGSRRFGKKVFGMGLLRGSSEASAAAAALAGSRRSSLESVSSAGDSSPLSRLGGRHLFKGPSLQGVPKTSTFGSAPVAVNSSSSPLNGMPRRLERRHALNVQTVDKDFPTFGDTENTLQREDVSACVETENTLQPEAPWLSEACDTDEPPEVPREHGPLDSSRADLLSAELQCPKTVSGRRPCRGRPSSPRPMSRAVPPQADWM